MSPTSRHRRVAESRDRVASTKAKTWAVSIVTLGRLARDPIYPHKYVQVHKIQKISALVGEHDAAFGEDLVMPGSNEGGLMSLSL